MDANSLVVVKRYYKRVPYTDPVTKFRKDYWVMLDWGPGSVDNGEYTILGDPHQFFGSDAASTPFADSRILIEFEELPASGLTGPPRDVQSDQVHFKYPNI